MSNCKIHTKYFLQDGLEVPGVTTILQVLSKPALIHWAWELGTQGIDYRKYRDDKADIGSLVHYLILCHFKGEKPDTSNYTPNQVDLAENCLLSFYEWIKNNPVEPILIEQSLVSEKYKYGGTIDLFGKHNSEFWLIDFKTGKGLYEEMSYQVAAYKQLLEENGYKVDTIKLLNIGRGEDENFQEKSYKNLKKHFKVFQACLQIYNLRKQLKKED